ncbi:S41 family peptidase [Streptomyces caelestis]|uniref:S41 family peptidase n=1 Tax=Streptomyces caelestis TaxID=36816 RepID=UPI00364A9980
MAEGFSVPGVEITHWSGIPVSAAVALNAARLAGGNAPARRSRGIQSPTVRPLRIHLPPFEERVTVSSIDGSGAQHELREYRRIVENLPPLVNADTVGTAALAQGLDLDEDEAGRAKVLLFTPRVVAQGQAVETGATFSSAFPLSPEDGANAIGQQHFGPVVLITDVRCSSATGIFAAGFQDHRIGPVLGTDENTGAGGANVWTRTLLSDLLEGDRATPYAPLPKGAGMRVSVRRALRVGALSGTPVEDPGVVPDEPYRMIRRDLLEDHADLFDRAGLLLKEREPHTVSVTDAVSVNGSLKLEVKAANVDRVDVHVDRRPYASAGLTGGRADVTVPAAAAARTARIDGSETGRLVAGRTERLP